MTHKRKELLKPDSDLVEGLKELRYRVENPNKQPSIALRGGETYKIINPANVQLLNYPPWQVGYKVVEDMLKPGMFTRTIFLKLPNEDIGEVNKEEMGKMVIALSELMDEGQDIPTVDRIARDCMKFTQKFMVWYKVEQKPNIIIPGKVGNA